ncbi:hypothetical protein BJV74DRAFT_796373 [Russula compacta]|nr:hypothetical protein BJV74DRAFT_796373 [Russula compacta]
MSVLGGGTRTTTLRLGTMIPPSNMGIVRMKRKKSGAVQIGINKSTLVQDLGSKRSHRIRDLMPNRMMVEDKIEGRNPLSGPEFVGYQPKSGHPVIPKHHCRGSCGMYARSLVHNHALALGLAGPLSPSHRLDRKGFMLEPDGGGATTGAYLLMPQSQIPAPLPVSPPLWFLPTTPDTSKGEGSWSPSHAWSGNGDGSAVSVAAPTGVEEHHGAGADTVSHGLDSVPGVACTRGKVLVINLGVNLENQSKLSVTGLT